MELVLKLFTTLIKRSAGAREAAVEMPRATFDGEYLHTDIFSMAAAYPFHLAESQTFVARVA